MLESFLFQIPDHRRGQGRIYKLGHILFFSILAILRGATSYRKIHTFIDVNYEELNAAFNLNWKRVPAYTTIRNIIQGTSGSELERVFRLYTKELDETKSEKKFLGCDGKVLRGSFDNFNDQNAIQIFSIFFSESRMILAHEEVSEKTNEIPTAQDLMEELGLSGYIFTFDALHCQKNARNS